MPASSNVPCSSPDRVNAALAAAPTLATVVPNAQSARDATADGRTPDRRARPPRHDRQIFFVATGGFDTHDDQATDQPGLLGEVSDALKAFYDATVELGVANSVTTFTQSDFGRTLTSNGDGTDHAWGGVQLVVGDAVRGRTIYGDYPLLAIDGPNSTWAAVA